MKGFDYRSGQSVTRSADEWRADLATIINEGGRRRVENGETFAHDANGIIVWEAYGNVRLPRGIGGDT